MVAAVTVIAMAGFIASISSTSTAFILIVGVVIRQTLMLNLIKVNSKSLASFLA